MTIDFSNSIFQEEGFPTVKLLNDHFEITDVDSGRTDSFRYDQILSIRYDSPYGKFWFFSVSMQGWASLFYMNRVLIKDQKKLEWSYKTLTVTNERLSAILHEIGRRCKTTEQH